MMASLSILWYHLLSYESPLKWTKCCTPWVPCDLCLWPHILGLGVWSKRLMYSYVFSKFSLLFFGLYVSVCILATQCTMKNVIQLFLYSIYPCLNNMMQFYLFSYKLELRVTRGELSWLMHMHGIGCVHYVWCKVETNLPNHACKLLW